MNWFKKIFGKKQKFAPIRENTAYDLPRAPLSEVYVDRAGNKFYQFSDPLQIPAIRAVSAEAALRHAEMCMTKDELQMLFVQMAKHCNEGKLVDLFALVREAQYRIENIAEEKTLLELACVYLVMNEEDERIYDADWQKRKISAMTATDESRAFFLSWAWRFTTKFSAMSELDIVDYLREMVSDDRLGRYLQPNT
jgi:hypothetical protein